MDTRATVKAKKVMAMAMARAKAEKARANAKGKVTMVTGEHQPGVGISGNGGKEETSGGGCGLHDPAAGGILDDENANHQAKKTFAGECKAVYAP